MLHLSSWMTTLPMMLIGMVGIILVIALLTLPAATAGCFTRHLWSMMLGATILSGVFLVGGLFGGFWIDLPSGPVIVVLAALVFALPVLAEGQEGQETVLLDLTKLAQAIISLAAGIVSLYLVPWLRSKLTNEQLSKAKSWVQIAVFAAEKLYGAGNGDQKLVYAEGILRKHGIRLDTATLKAMIDAQIKEMENMEPFYLADTKVEMIDNTKPETA